MMIKILALFDITFHMYIFMATCTNQERQRSLESDKEATLRREREKTRLDALQQGPLSLTNVSGYGFSIINLQYHTNSAGTAQKQADDLSKCVWIDINLSIYLLIDDTIITNTPYKYSKVQG